MAFATNASVVLRSVASNCNARCTRSSASSLNTGGWLTGISIGRTAHCQGLERNLMRRQSGSLRMTMEEVVEAAPRPSIKRLSTQRYYETYTWRGHTINYFVEGPEDAEPVLLVHGFGASVNHWRKTVHALLETNKFHVYAIDLLGFGASDKPSPATVSYCLELWRDLVSDFVSDFEKGKKWNFVGNSIGSLISLMTTKQVGPSRVRSCSLINSAGGLVSFRKSELNPVLGVLLQIFNAVMFNPVIGSALFRNLRKRESLKSVLPQIYSNQDAVTEELVDILQAPAFDDGAREVFLAIFNADAGPAPEGLLEAVPWCPILVCWGEDDRLTPFRVGAHPGINFPKFHPQIELHGIPSCGHCPHDDRAEQVHEHLIPFLLNKTAS